MTAAGPGKPRIFQIRSVPDDIHRSLKVRAAKVGMTLSDFLLAEITHVVNRPAIEDVVARLGGLDADFYTRDQRLSRAPGSHARVHVIA